MAFLDDLTIPFDNNQAERDLRLLKTRQKLGLFPLRRWRGRVSTLRKQGVALLSAPRALFTGNPLYPALS